MSKKPIKHEDDSELDNLDLYEDYATKRADLTISPKEIAELDAVIAESDNLAGVNRSDLTIDEDTVSLTAEEIAELEDALPSALLKEDDESVEPFHIIKDELDQD